MALLHVVYQRGVERLDLASGRVAEAISSAQPAGDQRTKQRNRQRERIFRHSSYSNATGNNATRSAMPRHARGQELKAQPRLSFLTPAWLLRSCVLAYPGQGTAPEAPMCGATGQ